MNKFDRSSIILMSAKAGVKHLQQKIAVIGKDIQIDDAEFVDTTPESTLWTTGNIMVEIMARTKEVEMIELHDIDIESSLLPLSQNDHHLETSFEYEVKLHGSRPFNQRITLPSAKDDLFDNDSGSEAFNDVDEDELSRDRVKKASTQIIRAQIKKSSKAIEMIANDQ